MNTKSDNAKWLNIPGFSNYRINSITREIQRYMKRTNEWRTLKGRATTGSVTLQSDKEKSLSVLPNRVCYCAMHKINPLLLDSKLYVVETPEKELQLCDSYGFAQHKMKNRPERSPEYIKGEYEKAQRVIKLILEAYETDNFTPVVAEIWSYENRITAYLKANNMAWTKDRIQEIWMQIFDTTLDAIKNRKAYIVNVYSYLRRVAITIVANDRKIKKRIRSLETMAALPSAMRIEDNIY